MNSGFDMTNEDELNYVSIEIDLAINYHRFFEMKFFIKKRTGEYVPICQKASYLQKTFEAYKERGLKEIFLIPDDYQKIVDMLRSSLESKKNFRDAFSDLNSLYNLSRNILLKQGFNRKVLEDSRDLNKLAIKHIIKVPDLALLLAEFKNTADKFFCRYIVQSFIINSMIKTFPWYSDQLLVKMGEACFLCDITLREEDFNFMISHPMTEWSEEQKSHPVIVAEKLRNLDRGISSDILKVIEQHHERPDGTGYPRGISHGNFSLLSTIFMIAAQVAEEFDDLCSESFDRDCLIQNIYRDYQKGVCRSASMALFSSLGLQF